MRRRSAPPGALHGGVVDWLHVSFYGPTFNLADVWLRGGVLIALAGWLWHRRTRHAGGLVRPAVPGPRPSGALRCR
jgi:hypothetical protein